MKKIVFICILLFAFNLHAASPPGGTMLVQDLDDCPSGKVCVDNTGAMSAPSVVIGTSSRNILKAALEQGDDIAVQIFGDSTSDTNTEWAHLLAESLGAAYPDYSVQYRIWNHTTQDFDAPETIQAGTNGVEHIEFNGTGSATVADGSIADFASDLDIRVKILPDQWPPAAVEVVAAHWGSAPNLSWYFATDTAGKLSITWSEDGTMDTDIYKASTAAATISTTTPSWVRVTLDLDNGAAGNDVAFYTSSDGNTWTQLGTTVTTATATTVAVVNYNWEIGGRIGTNNPFNGAIYDVEFRDGIDAWPSLYTGDLSTWALTTHGELVGGPTLFIINASRSGADFEEYWIDETRLPKACINYGQRITFLSSNQNEGANIGTAFTAVLSTFTNAIKAIMPLSSMVFMTQNPLTVSNTRQAHRRLDIINFADLNGYHYIDQFPAFNVNAAAYLEVDGAHPNAAGSAVWEDTVYNWVMSEVPR